VVPTTDHLIYPPGAAAARVEREDLTLAPCGQSSACF